MGSGLSPGNTSLLSYENFMQPPKHQTISCVHICEMGTGIAAPTELSCVELLGQCLPQEKKKVQYVRYFHDRGKQVQMGIVTPPQLHSNFWARVCWVGFLGVLISVSSLVFTRCGIFTHTFSSNTFSVQPPFLTSSSGTPIIQY